jgi:hypothetical protein
MLANMANGGRRSDEREMFDALVDLVKAGEDGIATRKLTNSPSQQGVVVLRAEPETYLVSKMTLARLERLASRGLARRVVDRRYGPEGSEETERFIRTGQATLSLADNDVFTVAEVTV